MKRMLHRLFQISASLKGVHAILNLLGSMLIYTTASTTLYDIAKSTLSNELLKDPNDVLVNFVLSKTEHLSRQTLDFAALYLFASGIINLIIVYGVLKEKPRSFPVAIACMSLFIAYQLYIFLNTLSPWIVALVIYDSLFIYLTFIEYRRIIQDNRSMSLQ